MPSYHPDEETLSTYVAGILGEAQSILVATHLTLCPSCRDFCENFDVLGGVMLSETVDEPVDVMSLDAVLARLDAPDNKPVALPDVADDETRRLVPRCLRERLGAPRADLAWKRMGRHIRYVDIAASEPGVTTRLLQLPSGLRLPTHTHMGNEMTIVLSGGFSDRFGHYLRGDVAIRDKTDKHRPIVDDGDDCLCFAVTDAPLRLTGPMGFLLNPFVNW